MEAGPDITASPDGRSARRRRCSCSCRTARRFRWLPSFAASVLLVTAGCRERTRLERIDAALARGGGFLASSQGPDGAIRSATYAYFKDGYSLTPLALAAMFAVPDEPKVAAAYPRGVDFVATMVGEGGKLRDDAQAPRYPLYSIAIGTIVLNVKTNARHQAARAALLAALRERQLGDENGWREADLSYGGWSYFDGVPRRPAAVTEPTEEVASNLSATLFAVGALALAGVAPGEPPMLRARRFVERCQNFPGDGGFFFSPAIADGNKAGAQSDAGGEAFRSYGSMTADGARALLRLGVPPADPRVAAARAWLEGHFDAERNPGDFVPVNEVRRASSYYYWTWSAAHALRDLGVTDVHSVHGGAKWAEALADALLARQRPDGSWANPQSEMREDDPIVATAFATAALGVCRMALSGQYRSHAHSP